MWDKDGVKTGEFILDCLKEKEEGISIISFLAWIGIIAVIVATSLASCDSEPIYAHMESKEFITECSYFTKASCIHEGTSGIMANGKVLRDDSFIAASWDFPLGTRLLITRVDRKDLSCVVVVCDRGPSKRLYKRGRRLDISLAAAKVLKITESGVAKISVEVI